MTGIKHSSPRSDHGDTSAPNPRSTALRDSRPRLRDRLHREPSLGHDSLTRAQCNALLEANLLVHAMASQPWEPPRKEAPWMAILPQIDEERFARTILLDGKRGTGKTFTFLHVVSKRSTNSMLRVDERPG
jgi:Cdc6-like AAA superfamily ATPase